MIQFTIKRGDSDPITTEWEDEPNQLVATARMVALRKEHGDGARISIQRTTVIPEQDRTQVRFKIVGKRNMLRYSKAVPIAEKDTFRATVQGKYPTAELFEEMV